jgi:predicted phosphodiesterase
MEKLVTNFKQFIARITGGLHLPEELLETDEKVLLHISDTPENIYPFLLELIDELVPDIVVHTGDVLDNFKLGLGLSEESYSEEVEEFLVELEQRQESEIYIVPGNHDSVDILREHTENIKLKDEGSILKVEGVKIGLAHFIENLPPQAEVNLFGHDKKTFSASGKQFLNGILSINVILLPSQEVFYIPYPWKTDTGRQYRRLKLP